MNITVFTKGFPLTDALSDKTKRQFHGSLSSFEGKIQRMEVTLEDINGPKGGKDKRCQAHVIFDGLKPVIVEDIEEDMYAAINACAARIKRTVKRQIEKNRQLARAAS